MSNIDYIAIGIAIGVGISIFCWGLSQVLIALTCKPTKRIRKN